MSAYSASSSRLVSVVIPSYNHERYILTAVTSVLAQTYDNFELIVVDDGSSDNSVDLISQVKDPRIKIITQENCGAHNAINRGLEIAKGEFLAILNSDDVFHPDRLKLCLEQICETGSDLVASWLEVIDQDGDSLGIKQGWKNMLPWDIPKAQNTFGRTEDFALNLLVSNFVSTTSNVFFSRNLFNAVGGMRNLRFTHDWDFLLRASSEFKCNLIPIPLVKYRIHDTNTISSNRQWMLFEICWVLAAGLRLFEGSRLYAGATDEDWVSDARLIQNSIQLQGNDKVFWMIRQFVDSQTAQGVAGADLMLLDNANLRRPFMDAIVDTHTLEARADNLGAKPMSSLLRALRRRLR